MIAAGSSCSWCGRSCRCGWTSTIVLYPWGETGFVDAPVERAPPELERWLKRFGDAWLLAREAWLEARRLCGWQVIGRAEPKTRHAARKKSGMDAASLRAWRSGRATLGASC